MFYCIATKDDRFTVSTYSLISDSYIGLGGRACTFCLFILCCHPVCVMWFVMLELCHSGAWNPIGIQCLIPSILIPVASCY